MNITYFMNEAIKEANKAFINNEVPIGCVLVQNNTNEIIGRGYNKINKKKNAIYHCELDIIIKSCNKLSKKYLNDTSIFVTLEPCIMCAAAISEVHISNLYYGAYDEKNGGIERHQLALKRKNIFIPEVYGGIMEKECKTLLTNFFRKIR